MPDPLLFEINTRCWLGRLSEEAGRLVTLADVPGREFEEWRQFGFSHLWLMGAWSSGPLARRRALAGPHQRETFSQALPGWQEQDVSGSPYAIGDYFVPAELGSESGLRAFRRKLNAAGLKLVLDFVPNHLGLDHPWVRERPELFVQGEARTPETFPQQTADGVRWLAHGKDPNFAAWTDTLQLDYRRADTQAAMKELLLAVAERCDGVRCDMAMLVLADVFAATWKGFPASGLPAAGEFWPAAISAAREAHPEFLFLAEAYWGLEPRLQALGFDYTYDKELYDRLVARDAIGVRRHLAGLAPEVLSRGAHFLENHDEPRVASLLTLDEHQAAALVVLGLPGMRLLHEGQLVGARLRCPVQLRRRFLEPVDAGVARMYERLLSSLRATAVGRGRGQLLEPLPAWPGNPTAENFVVVRWEVEPPEFDSVAVNLAPHASQCRVPLSLGPAHGQQGVITERFSGEQQAWPAEDFRNQRFYLDLPASGVRLLHFQMSAPIDAQKNLK